MSPDATVTATHHGVVASSSQGRFELKGSDVRLFLTHLVPLLDGSRTIEQVATSLDGYKPDSVRSLLELLQAKGVVEHVPEVGGDGIGRAAGHEAQERFFQALGLAPGAATRALAAAHVLIVGLEAWGTAAAVELAAAGVGALSLLDDGAVAHDELLALRGVGVSTVGALRHQVARELVERVADVRVQAAAIPTALRRPDMGPVHAFAAPPPSLVVIAASGEELLLRFQVARAAHEAGIPTFSAHMEGTEVWLGPATAAGTTPCWNCLRMRRLALDDQVMQAHSIQAQLMGAPPPPRPRSWLAPMAPLAGHLLATELIKLLSGAPVHSLLGRVRVHDLLHGTATTHGLARLPWCPVCGGAQAALDRAREAGVDTTGAGMPPAVDLPSLLARMEGWLDPRLGVMRSLEVKPAGPPLPLTSSTRLANYTEGDPSAVSPGAFGGGKGLTPFDAQVGAIGEAIERYSASRYRLADVRVARLSELDGDAIDPRRLCFYDDAVYRATDNSYVPFDPERPIHWVEGRWFGTADPVWVPAVAAFFGLRVGPEEQLLQVTSSGLAAGVTTTDAALRAVFELMERDATMITWLCQLPGRRIVLDDSLDPGIAQMVRYMEARGVRLELYLLDVGVELPTVFCLGFGDDRCVPAVAASLSCHGDARAAVHKALLEQAHVGPYLATIGPERIPSTADGVRTLEDHALYYVPPGREAAFEFLRAGDQPALALAELPARAFPTDPVAGTAVVAERLRAAKLKVATVDLTSPDVYFTPFRVARAVGLDVQPIHFGYRLRPLTNPRLRERLGPRGVNPYPHPIA